MKILFGILAWLLALPVVPYAMNAAHLANMEYRADPAGTQPHPHTLPAVGSWAVVIVLLVVGLGLIASGVQPLLPSRTHSSRYGGSPGFCREHGSSGGHGGHCHH
jgi:hypothetical protein